MRNKKNSTNISLSIIIPLYNEAKRLNNLYKIYEYLNKERINYEIILVNDGSSDGTLRKLRKLRRKFKFKILSYAQNRGKGFAIRTGMLEAKGKYRLFTDVDLSTPMEELADFLPYLKKYDVVIGSRKMKGSRLTRRQNLLRENLGKSFTLISKIILSIKISDFTCGFKCFSERSAEEIFKRQKISGWSFDSEILFIARKLSFNVKELPVSWKADPKSKVKFPDAIISSLVDLAKIRYYNYKRLYD